jgi:hypothetical protein
MGVFVSRVSICLELALPYPRVMLCLKIRGENDMSKHHAIYMRGGFAGSDLVFGFSMAAAASRGQTWFLVSRWLSSRCQTRKWGQNGTKCIGCSKAIALPTKDQLVRNVAVCALLIQADVVVLVFLGQALTSGMPHSEHVNGVAPE